MEPHQQQQLQEDSSSSSKSSFICRQSSTRWNPTTDQIRILKDLYYNNGVRSPNAEQIQRISARLRQYGKIEGKNVFYWFQNHKARERQKKRFTVDIGMQRGWKPEDSIPNKYCNMGFSSPSSSSSPGMVGVGQMGSSGYGSVLMEKSFRECSISGSGYMGKSNVGWMGLESSTASPYICLDGMKNNTGNTEAEAPHMPTLQLFPMHEEEDHHATTTFCMSKADQLPTEYFPSWFLGDHSSGGTGTSLELSLSSYSGGATDSM